MKKSFPDKQSNFLLYTGNDERVSVEVFLKDETVWLTQKAIGKLFGKSKATISEHLKKIYAEGEADGFNCSEIPNSSNGRIQASRKNGNILSYKSEQLIPTKTDKHPPLLLVLGNPATH